MSRRSLSVAISYSQMFHFGWSSSSRVEALVDGAAHREQHLAAVARDLDARDVARAFREALRDVALRSRRRSAIANVEIRPDGEAQDVAQVGVDLELVVLVVERAFRVRDRKIRSDRIGILARADADAAVAVAAARGDRRGGQREREHAAVSPRRLAEQFRVSLLMESPSPLTGAVEGRSALCRCVNG